MLVLPMMAGEMGLFPTVFLHFPMHVVLHVKFRHIRGKKYLLYVLTQRQ